MTREEYARAANAHSVRSDYLGRVSPVIELPDVTYRGADRLASWRVVRAGESRVTHRDLLVATVHKLLGALAPDPLPFSPLIRGLLSQIHEHASEPKFSVRTAKLLCGVRDNNISCRFKHEVGASIKEYIEMLRLEVAYELLLAGTFTTADIADAVGYIYLQTFYRAFGRRFNRAPGSVSRAEMRRVDVDALNRHD
jgi:transcriptional regulator GlxA family with amidase domain